MTPPAAALISHADLKIASAQRSNASPSRYLNCLARMNVEKSSTLPRLTLCRLQMHSTAEPGVLSTNRDKEAHALSKGIHGTQRHNTRCSTHIIGTSTRGTSSADGTVHVRTHKLAQCNSRHTQAQTSILQQWHCSNTLPPSDGSAHYSRNDSRSVQNLQTHIQRESADNAACVCFARRRLRRAR